MSEKELLYAYLEQIENTILHILERTEDIKSMDDFLSSPHGVDMLDVSCVRLEAIGETVKKINKKTDEKLLCNYSSIPWKKIMGIRNIIAHHYFDVDVEVVFNIIKNDLHPLLQIIGQIKSELK
jgi:uncharacterized protein with HEPN domain